jgi:CDP-paratose 2-epimerase
MRTVIVTGYAGLIGFGNNKTLRRGGGACCWNRQRYARPILGAEASTKKTRVDLIANIRGYDHHDLDIRDAPAVAELFKSYSGKIDAIVHTASQPSHDWAARDPQIDFTMQMAR